MKPRSALTLGYAGARIAYGAALLAQPERTARGWLGDGLAGGAARVGARGLGARDGLMAAGFLHALRRRHDPRPWLAALAASDLVDIGATLTDRRDLPRHSPLATTAVAGAFCACGVALACA